MLGTDLMVNSSYDLVMDRNAIVRTNYADMNHTLAQVMYILVQSKPGDFALNRKFGASPRVFIGNNMNTMLLKNIEDYMTNQIRNSALLPSGVGYNVKAVPVARDQIAIRVKVTLGPDSWFKYDMLYNTSDNSIKPVSYGG